MLDMRGKKKKGTFEKYEHGNWLPRSPIGATRHYSQIGFTLSALCRSTQRKVYPTEASLKRALLSMLPKHLRNMEMKLEEWNAIYGEKDNYLATFKKDGVKVEGFSIKKHPKGWKLGFGGDTIRSCTKELLEGLERIDAINHAVSEPEQMILMTHEAEHSELMEKFLDSKDPLFVERNLPIAEGCEELVGQLKEQRKERTERMIQRVETSLPWVVKYSDPK